MPTAGVVAEEDGSMNDASSDRVLPRPAFCLCPEPADCQSLQGDPFRSGIVKPGPYNGTQCWGYDDESIEI